MCRWFRKNVYILYNAVVHNGPSRSSDVVGLGANRMRLSISDHHQAYSYLAQFLRYGDLKAEYRHFSTLPFIYRPRTG